MTQTPKLKPKPQMPKDRLLPKPTPETAHFWEGTKVGELRLQQCDDCNHVYFPPRPFCPKCTSDNVQVIAASGKATLYSYAISARPAPGIEAPYSVAVVTLEEGPRLMTNIVDCPQTPEALVLDMPLKAVFHAQNEEITLPFFAPESPQ